MGVDIIQNCEVIGFDASAGKINGIRTSRGNIKAKKVGRGLPDANYVSKTLGDIPEAKFVKMPSVVFV